MNAIGHSSLMHCEPHANKGNELHSFKVPGIDEEKEHI
jgi:hypothetical protein